MSKSQLIAKSAPCFATEAISNTLTQPRDSLQSTHRRSLPMDHHYLESLSFLNTVDIIQRILEDQWASLQCLSSFRRNSVDLKAYQPQFLNSAIICSTIQAAISCQDVNCPFAIAPGNTKNSTVQSQDIQSYILHLSKRTISSCRNFVHSQEHRLHSPSSDLAGEYY